MITTECETYNQSKRNHHGKLYIEWGEIPDMLERRDGYLKYLEGVQDTVSMESWDWRADRTDTR